MPYITQVAVGKLQELSVFGNDYDTHDGTGVRDYIEAVCSQGPCLFLKHNLENKESLFSILVQESVIV